MHSIKNIDNQKKQQSGKVLDQILINTFSELQSQKIIKSFDHKVNFSHSGFSYKRQYLANFILTTLEDKFIVINSSNSFRHDRVKLQSYDIEGVTKNADISKDIIASVLLYPDAEASNNNLERFRQLVQNKQAYCPASHLFLLHEFLDFLDNYKSETESHFESVDSEPEDQRVLCKRDGSYYGKQGNQFENDVVNILNSPHHQRRYEQGGTSGNEIFDLIINQAIKTMNIRRESIIGIEASNTVLKLRNGGNAKTDIICQVKTREVAQNITISVKNTTQSRVSCHDYKVDDFIRVLEINKDSKTSNYLKLFQQEGSDKNFKASMGADDSIQEFNQLFEPYVKKLTEWALTGKHDSQNILDHETQISNFILIKKDEQLSFTSFEDYISLIFSSNKKLSYGTPFSWTYPSKNRGKRIQLKMPIIL